VEGCDKPGGAAKRAPIPGSPSNPAGPGGVHLLNGLYDARSDGIPVLAITGHTFHDLIGTHYQQDIDLVKLFMDVSVYNERVMGPAHLPNVLDEAIRTAMTRRRVAHLCIPKDIQDLESAEGHRSSDNVKGHSPDGYAPMVSLPAPSLLQMAADLLNKGEKVAILAGRGALQARAEVLELAERLGAPIVKPLLGKAVVPDDHPLTTGGIGLLGTAPSQDVMKACDTLLIVGSSFPYMEFLPKPGQAKIVQIDLDGTRIGLRCPTDVGLIGDSQLVLKALLPLVQRKPNRKFLESAQADMKQWNQLMQERGTNPDKPL
jgi:pyruvate dehydrogenase (quinone)